jgi:hypothetical protein
MQLPLSKPKIKRKFWLTRTFLYLMAATNFREGTIFRLNPAASGGPAGAASRM